MSLDRDPEVAAQEPAPPPARSKLPLVIGAAVVVIGGGIAAFFATRSSGPATHADQGSNIASAAPVNPGSAAVAVTPPPPPQPPPPPPLPDMVVITLDSKPQGATVRDLKLDKALGKTPLKVKLAGSREPRDFAFHLHGYSDSTVEIPLTKDTIAYTEQLVKGASTAAPIVHKVVDETLKTVPDLGTAVTHPDLTPTKPPETTGSVAKPPETHPDTGAQIEGTPVPCWNEVKARAVEAHRAFDDRVVIGWDVAVLADGPVLVEGNGNPDLDILQRFMRTGLREHRFGELLAHHLRQRAASAPSRSSPVRSGGSA